MRRRCARKILTFYLMTCLFCVGMFFDSQVFAEEEIRGAEKAETEVSEGGDAGVFVLNGDKDNEPRDHKEEGVVGESFEDEVEGEEVVAVSEMSKTVDDEKEVQDDQWASGDSIEVEGENDDEKRREEFQEKIVSKVLDEGLNGGDVGRSDNDCRMNSNKERVLLGGVEISKSKLVINEVMIEDGSSSKNEFIEIFNPSAISVDLKNWKLTKVTKSGNESNLVSSPGFKGMIEAGGYFVVKNPAYSGLEIFDLEYSNSSNSVAKDNAVVLYDSSGDLVDMLCWGSGEYECLGSYFSDSPEPGFGLARKNGGEREFEMTSIVTPGAENIFPEKKVYSDLIFLNEILPNPDGVDKNNEWIELFNNGETEVDLTGWLVENGSGKRFIVKSGIIKPKEFFVVKVESGSFSVRNSNERLLLLDPNKKIVDTVIIKESARSGLSYNNDGRGTWSWSKNLSPGAVNLLNSLPILKMKKSKDVYKGIYAEFSASGTRDGDGDGLKFRWDFGDGHRSYLKKTRHKYEESGKYEVVLEVDDGIEVVSKKILIKVKSFPKYKLKIVRVVPNPKGRDVGREIVTIRNYYKRKLNLEGYKLATGRNKTHLVNHPIYEDFFVKTGNKKDLISGDTCKYSLLNNGGVIALLYPDGKIADMVNYEKERILDDEEYVFSDGKDSWEWLGGIAVNEKNFIGAGVSVVSEEDTSYHKSSNNYFVVVTKNDSEMICECAQKVRIENWKSKNGWALDLI